MFGRKCPYYDFCRDNSMKDLVKLDFKKKG